MLDSQSNIVSAIGYIIRFTVYFYDAGIRFIVASRSELASHPLSAPLTEYLFPQIVNTTYVSTDSSPSLFYLNHPLSFIPESKLNYFTVWENAITVIVNNPNKNRFKQIKAIANQSRSNYADHLFHENYG